MDMITQCACVLLERAPALEDVERALEDWNVVGPQEAAAGEDGWLASGPGFVLELRNGGAVMVDLVDHRWPDEPGIGGAAEVLGAAYRSGLFGPTAAPGALRRAAAQAWSWEGGAAAAEAHRGFLRLRTVVELVGDPPALPAEHDPVHELTALTELSASLLRLSGATAVFFPGGEALRSREQVEAVLRRKTGIGPPAVELWANLRAFPLGEIAGTRWMVVDTVGMAQLRLPDQEAVFAEQQEPADAVAWLLTSASLHLLARKPFADGASAQDASGRRWKGARATSTLAPDRSVVRWLPQQGATPDDALLARLGARGRPTQG